MHRDTRKHFDSYRSMGLNYLKLTLNRYIAFIAMKLIYIIRIFKSIFTVKDGVSTLNTLPTVSGSNILCPFTACSAADCPKHRLGFDLDWTSKSRMVESKFIRALEIIRVKKLLPNAVL